MYTNLCHSVLFLFFQIIENMKRLTIIVKVKSWFASKHSTETAIFEAWLLTAVYSETEMIALSLVRLYITKNVR